MGIDSVRTAHRARSVRNRHRLRFPIVAPRIESLVCSLCGILPFPLMRQALSRPSSISSRVFEGNPNHGLVVPACGVVSVRPVPEEVKIVLGMIVSGIQKFLELRIRDWVFVNPERPHMHGMIMKAAWGILPCVLYIHANIVEAFDLDPLDLKAKISFGNLYHICGRA